MEVVLPRETDTVDRKEGDNGEGNFYAEGDGEGGQEAGISAIGRGDFYDGMPGWTYFSRATPGHPASNIIIAVYL